MRMRFGTQVEAPRAPTPGRLTAFAVALRQKLSDPDVMKGREAIEIGELYALVKDDPRVTALVETEEAFSELASDALLKTP